MNEVQGCGGIVDEPAWDLLLTDDREIAVARDHWRRVTTEMRERQTLAATNGHAIQRLVLAYVLFDRCSREVAENGAVTQPKRGNPKSIARLSPHFAAMREYATDATSLEAELGISPRRRNGVGKVDRRGQRRAGADQYLKPVAK
jgi:P27 family predicted phage terminase small subunit